METSSKRTLTALRKRIAKFNALLVEYYKETENSEIPEIETTIIGSGSYIEPYQITNETENGFDVVCDGFPYEIRVEYLEEYEEEYVSGVEDVDEQIKYDKRRINKGLRVWRSENPDKELERDDEPEE